MNMERIVDIKYGPHSRNIGDFLSAERPDSPLILLIHGGGWGTLDRYSMAGVALFLQQSGFSVFNIEYRLCTEASWPACGDDCLCALNYLRRANPRSIGEADPARIGIVGASAGGHLALMTALRAGKDEVRAVVSISGITDLTLYQRTAPDCIPYLFGKEASGSDVENASPVHLLTADCPPTLLTHSCHDNVVEIANAYSYTERARQVNAPVEFFEYSCLREAKQSHCIWRPGSQPHKLYPELEDVIASFLHRNLDA